MRRQRVLKSCILVALAFALEACSTMPTWTKPSTWYDSVTGDPVAVDKAAQEQDKKAAAAAPVGDFPLLSQTPTAPVVSTTPAQRKEIRDSLAVDRDRTNASVQAVKAIETPETRATAAKKQKGP